MGLPKGIRGEAWRRPPRRSLIAWHLAAAHCALRVVSVVAATVSLATGIGALGCGGKSSESGSPCMPTTCLAQAKNCGTISDGCSAVLNCGTCTGSETCGGGQVANVCGSSGGFVISTPLQFNSTAIQVGETLTGTVTYKNTSAVAIPVNSISIAGRPPGGTNSGGPFDDLTPMDGNETVQPGATITLTASRAFTSTDPTGQWYSYATYEDTESLWHDGPSVYFTVGSCKPTTCAMQDAACGTISDGCGGLLNCGTCNSCQSSGGPGANEPSGMTVMIDTGPMTHAPPTAPGSWTEGPNPVTGTGITTKYTMFSAAGIANGQGAGTTTLGAGGSGMQTLCSTALDESAGYQTPVEYGTSGGLGANPGTGTMYMRFQITFSSNWDNSPAPTGTKIGEPRTMVTGQSTCSPCGTDHILMTTYDVTGDPTKMQPGIVIQGPVKANRNLWANVGSSPGTIGLITDGAPHFVECLMIQEAPAGASNGIMEMWVDGVLIANHNDVTYLAPGCKKGWAYLLNEFVIGGVWSGHLAQDQCITLDKWYVSVK
jgi:hypothetical protein